MPSLSLWKGAWHKTTYADKASVELKAAIRRDMCYKPKEIDNAPLGKDRKKEFLFPDIYDGKQCNKFVSGEFKARSEVTKGAGRKGIYYIKVMLQS